MYLITTLFSLAWQWKKLLIKATVFPLSWLCHSSPCHAWLMLEGSLIMMRNDAELSPSVTRKVRAHNVCWWRMQTCSSLWYVCVSGKWEETELGLKNCQEKQLEDMLCDSLSGLWSHCCECHELEQTLQHCACVSAHILLWKKRQTDSHRYTHTHSLYKCGGYYCLTKIQTNTLLRAKKKNHEVVCGLFVRDIPKCFSGFLYVCPAVILNAACIQISDHLTRVKPHCAAHTGFVIITSVLCLGEVLKYE